MTLTKKIHTTSTYQRGFVLVAYQYIAGTYAFTQDILRSHKILIINKTLLIR